MDIRWSVRLVHKSNHWNDGSLGYCSAGWKSSRRRVRSPERNRGHKSDRHDAFRTFTCRRLFQIRRRETSRLRSALHALRKTKHPETDLIFCTPTGQPLDPRYVVRKQFEPALQRAGWRRLRFHDLRHTYVTLAIQQGAHPKFIQHQLGHMLIQTTLDRYGHLLLKDHEDLNRLIDELPLWNDRPGDTTRADSHRERQTQRQRSHGRFPAVAR